MRALGSEYLRSCCPLNLQSSKFLPLDRFFLGSCTIQWYQFAMLIRKKNCIELVKLKNQELYSIICIWILLDSLYFCTTRKALHMTFISKEPNFLYYIIRICNMYLGRAKKNLHTHILGKIWQLWHTASFWLALAPFYLPKRNIRVQGMSLWRLPCFKAL